MVVGELTGPSVDRIFHALADATRRDILARVIRDAQSVSGLARRYPISFAAVQKHVAVLEQAALVTKQRRGREQLVHGNVTTLRTATRLLAAYEELWQHRASRIEQILAEDREPKAESRHREPKAESRYREPKAESRHREPNTEKGTAR